MDYVTPELVTSYMVTDLYGSGQGFASLAACTDPYNNKGDLGGPFPCTPT